MSISTYAELQTAISNWLNNSQADASIPTFISLAEGVIKRELRTMDQEKRAYAQTVAGESVLPLPTDFNGMRNVIVRGNPKTSLTQVTLDKLYKSYASTYTGSPLMFAVADDALHFGPTPDAAYEVEMAYFAFDDLSDANTTNSVLSRHPDLYLMWSMVFASQYMRESELEVKYSSQATQLLEQAVNDGKDRQFGAIPLKTVTQYS